MLKEIWVIQTKSRQQLEKANYVVSDGQMWQSVNHNKIKFSKNNEDMTLLVERYCKGAYVSIKAPKGLVQGSIHGQIIGHVVPEWACRKVTVVDPEIDAEYFI